ncbi:MAG: hypothetical protein DRJ01_06170 [Bacteroidetes bacterium]|nr:MAG: hypothetical protein DRJ01_06170 [Bacteroidota bacterium]
MKKILLLLTLIVFSQIVFSQTIEDTKLVVPMVSVSYSLQVPGGDLANRFGVSSTLGASFMVKTKSNFLFGIDANYLFGQDVKENGVLDSISTSNGQVINIFGEYSGIKFFERGFHINVKAGKIIPLFGPNENSGLLITASAGLLQHKIRIENDGNNTPSVLNDYAKGYDRLSNGLAISEFIGYMYFSNNGRVNFYAGFELTQAWTKNRRSWNFDTMENDDQLRNDYLYAFKFGWIITLHKKMTNKFYYY